LNRFRAVVSVLVLAACGSAVGMSSAAAKPVPNTTVEVRGVNGSEEPGVVFGTVSSPKSQKCVAGRKVKILLQSSPSGPLRQVDTARASADGAWAGEIPDGPIVEIAAQAPKSKYGPKHHRKTCDAAHDELHFV
jgi:hypothetical protein